MSNDDVYEMVSDLAYLVKRNIRCKDLIFEMEDKLVKFVEDDTSSDAVLELEPMNSFNRMLVHRLADIFGLTHESVGEGDYKRLVLKRCPETSMPERLVSDFLFKLRVTRSPDRYWENDDTPVQGIDAVEKLASLVKDNIPSKNMILELEDELVDILDSSSGGVLELEPMDPFNRMLVHRLANIFGFDHYSVGKGKYRHLCLKCSLMSSIPETLVSDVLLQPSESESSTTSESDGTLGQSIDDTVGGSSLEEMKDVACDSKLIKKRPQNDPALGQPNNKVIKHDLSSSDAKEYGQTATGVKTELHVDESDINFSSSKLVKNELYVDESGINSSSNKLVKTELHVDESDINSSSNKLVKTELHVDESGINASSNKLVKTELHVDESDINCSSNKLVKTELFIDESGLNFYNNNLVQTAVNLSLQLGPPSSCDRIG